MVEQLKIIIIIIKISFLALNINQKYHQGKTQFTNYMFIHKTPKKHTVTTHGRVISGYENHQGI